MPYSTYKRVLAKSIIRGLHREAKAEKRLEAKVNKALSAVTAKAQKILNDPWGVNQLFPSLWRVRDSREYLIDLEAPSCKCWLFKEVRMCAHLFAATCAAKDAKYFAQFQGNHWQVWNLEKHNTEEHYTTTNQECDCPDWIFRRSKDGTRCKHQSWFYPPIQVRKKRKVQPPVEASEAFPVWPEVLPRETSVNESNLPRGVWLEKTDEWTFNEYFVCCYEICNGREKKICIGRLCESSSGIHGCLPRGNGSIFSSTRQAVLFLIRGYGLKLEQIEAAMDLVEF